MADRKRRAQELSPRDRKHAQRLEAVGHERLHAVEEPGLREQRDRQEQREQKVVFRVLVPRLAQGQGAHPRDGDDAKQRDGESGKGRQEQRHPMIDAVEDQETDERQQRQRAEELRAAPLARRGCQHVVDVLRGQHRPLVVPGGIERVVAIEPVRQFLARVVTEQLLRDSRRHAFLDERRAE